MRSGFADSPTYARSFWAGDQLESWGIDNGLESGITAYKDLAPYREQLMKKAEKQAHHS